MPKFIGNRFGSIIPISSGSNAPSGVYDMFDQYYASRQTPGTGWVTAPLTATGGNATAEPGNGYKYHFFTSNGDLVVDAPGDIDFIVIGGGGAGGNSSANTPGAGGGGARI